MGIMLSGSITSRQPPVKTRVASATRVCRRAVKLTCGVEQYRGSPSDLWWGVVGDLPEAVATP